MYNSCVVTVGLLSSYSILKYLCRYSIIEPNTVNHETTEYVVSIGNTIDRREADCLFVNRWLPLGYFDMVNFCHHIKPSRNYYLADWPYQSLITSHEKQVLVQVT